MEQSIPWNCLHPSIQAATIVGRSAGAGVFCTFCWEPDHREDACALAYFHPQKQQPPHLDNPPAANRNQPRSKGDPPSDICHSWNRGSCIYPTTCCYRHICSLCFQCHMVCDCLSPSSATLLGPKCHVAVAKLLSCTCCYHFKFSSLLASHWLYCHYI